jgi:hypothetical protein
MPPRRKSQWKAILGDNALVYLLTGRESGECETCCCCEEMEEF